MEHTDVLILGAGISGMTAARFLTSESTILEKRAFPGGLSTQYASGPYWFDFGGHYFHFHNAPAIREQLSDITPFQEHHRRSRVFLMNRFIPFPIQDHIAFLPAPLRRRIRKEISWNPKLTDTRMDSYLRSRFGETLFSLFFSPFMTKYYQRNLSELAVGLEHGSIPLPNRKSLFSNKRKETETERGYNPVFFYPRKGLREFWNKYRASVRTSLRLTEEVVRIDIENRCLETKTRSYSFQRLISSLPLPHLIAMMKGLPDLTRQCSRLSHTSTRVVNLVLAKRRRRFHWVYLPEKAIPFYRFGYYPGAGYCTAYLEQSFPPTQGSHPRDPGIETTLIRLGAIQSAKEILHVSIREIPISYILHDHAWAKTVPPLLALLRKMDIHSIGRYGGWTYSSMSQDALNAMDTALAINALRG